MRCANYNGSAALALGVLKYGKPVKCPTPGGKTTKHPKSKCWIHWQLCGDCANLLHPEDYVQMRGSAHSSGGMTQKNNSLKAVSPLLA